MIKKGADLFSVKLLLEYDVIRGFLLICLTMCAFSIVKRILKKRGYGLLECIECGKTWSPKQARKFFWENRGIECSICGKKQYRTKKSIQLGLLLTSLLNISITFIAILSNFFDHFIVGMLFYLLGIIIYSYQLAPYLFDLQEDDPSNDPL